MPSLIDPLPLEKMIFEINFVKVFSQLHYYLPLEKGETLHLNKLESPLPMDAVRSLVEIGPVVLEMKLIILKVYRRTDR